MLLEVPDEIHTDIYFSKLNRVNPPIDITIEELILKPRAISSDLIAKKEIWLKHKYAEDRNVYSDVLFVLLLLHNKYTYSVHPTINYIYSYAPFSIQNSKPFFLSQVKTHTDRS